ncbi:phosphate ABC transporter permease [filamentous cyanobacterium CCP1]|nr:phosphate ABC transporter permease [filamentous cyanobacterium CCP2]PSB67386.1 phosphate ABC transporter permease [filamentous cyanobacterium CCP1]
MMAIGLSLFVSGVFHQEWFNAGGVPQLFRFLRSFLNPDLSPEFLQLTGNATLITLAYAVCGTALSVAIGLIGGILCSEVWWNSVFPSRQNTVHSTVQKKSPWIVLRATLAIPRSIHELIWGLFFVNIFGLDPLVGILAIAIPYGAIVSKVFSELLDETPRQPLHALLNSGVAPLTAFCYTLLPQAFLDLLSYTFYRFECSIRSAAVLGIIGAGGLGYQIILSLQSLRYEQLWTLFIALFFLTGSVDLSSALLRRHLGSPSRIDLNLRKRSALTSLQSRSLQNQKTLQINAFALIVLFALILFCFWYVEADFSKLWSSRTLNLLQDIAHASFPPAFNWEILQQLVRLSLQTIAMSILAIVLAGIGGIVLSFPAAYNFFLPGGLIRATRQNLASQILAWMGLLLTRSVLLIFRAIPSPIWALVMLFVLFPGILPGAIALGLHNMGILGRLMAEVNENLDQRPLQALKAQGTPASLIFLYGVLPLTLTRFLAYILYRWEVCTRETVIVGLVGAGGLGRLLTEQLSSFDYRSVIVTLGVFILLTFGVDWLSGIARRSLR